MRRHAAAPRRRRPLLLLALALALALAAPRTALANKKNAPSSSAASVARERAEAAAALDGVTTPASAAGPAAAPTAAQAAKSQAAELGVTAAHSGRTKGPSPRVGYLRLQPLLSSVDPLARARARPPRLGGTRVRLLPPLCVRPALAVRVARRPRAARSRAAGRGAPSRCPGGVQRRLRCWLLLPQGQRPWAVARLSRGRHVVR
jgi:hypothetical protein